MMNHPGNKCSKFDIIIGKVATSYFFNVSDLQLSSESLPPYNNDLEEALIHFFLLKKKYLTKQQAIAKFGDKVDSPLKIHGLFHVQNNQGEWVYIDPYQLIIVEKEYRYFPLFFAVQLMQVFENNNQEDFNRFLDYQLKTNFEKNIGDSAQTGPVIPRQTGPPIPH
jgi:hypothetical protein